jgi:colanic acid biosynthesis glycosyl transferase WcaI
VESLRVLILGLNYAPETTGIAPYTTGLANGLAARGHLVRVLTGLPHYPQWAITPGYESGRSVTGPGRPEVHHLAHHVPPPGSLRGRVRMELSYGRRIATAPWHTTDAIVCVSPALLASAAAIARAKSMRCRPGIGLWVQDLYGLGVAETGTLGAHAARALGAVEGRVLRSADRVAVIHDRFKSHLVTDLGVRAEDVTVIRNWTHLQPTKRRSRLESRFKLGWGADEIVALHAGNMGAKQGLENVIAAAKLAQTRGAAVRFVLLGDGNRRSQLEHLSRGLHNVQMIEPLPDEDYRSAITAADVLLVNEKATVAEMAVPSKITSYFTSGNPIVAATRADSITASEINVSGGGLVVPPDDPALLLTAVQKLGADPDLAQRLGRAGAAFCHHKLSTAYAIDQFEQWIRQLAAEPRGLCAIDERSTRT